jgi:hypothetical protein
MNWRFDWQRALDEFLQAHEIRRFEYGTTCLHEAIVSACQKPYQRILGSVSFALISKVKVVTKPFGFY